MCRIQVKASPAIVGRILAIVAVTLLSACHKPLINVENSVNVNCPPGQMGPSGQTGSQQDDGPGLNCHTNQVLVPAGSPVPTNAVPINPVPADGKVPTGATCSSKAGSGTSHQCDAVNILGKACGIPATKKCHNTYDMTSTVCGCEC